MKKNIGIFAVIGALIVIIGIGINNSVTQENTENSESNNEIKNTISEEKVIDIESMAFEETEPEIEIDIKEEKDLLLVVNPIDATKNSLTFYSTNQEVLSLQKNYGKSIGNKIYVKITPSVEGESEIYAFSKGVESNRIKVKVIDKERIENEKKEEEERKRKEEEEQARQEEERKRKEAEEQARQEEERKRKEAEEQARQEEARKAAEQSSSSSKSKQETESSTSNSKTVYITPTGKRYHYLSTCGGKNSRATTLSNAISLGLTPCKKCAN